MIKILKEVEKKDLEDWLYKINEEDKNLYIEVNNPNKIGIFQLNGNTAEKLCEQIKPENFDEIIAVNAIARPGPMEVCAPFYVERKKSGISPYPPEVNEILRDSHYTFLFQEQIIETFNKIGGFSLDAVDEVRGLMKKLSKAEKVEEDVKAWDKVVKKFARGAAKLGIEESMALKISQDLQAFSSYSFNKSHATSYSYIALITLYLSYYFREYFYSSVLSYEMDRDKYLLDRINSVRAQGIKILPPDINKSNFHFEPEEAKKIRIGLNDIKFVGEKAVSVILEERRDKEFSSFIDFYIRTRGRAITSKVIEALVSVGCFDWEESNRKKLLQTIKIFLENKKSNKVEEKLREIYFNAKGAIDSLPLLETTIEDSVSYEKTFYGIKIFSSLFTDEVLGAINKLKKANLIYSSINEVRERSMKIPVTVNSIRSFNDRNGNEMAFVNIEDQTGKEVSIPIFQSYWKLVKNGIIRDKLYLMNVYKNDDSIIFGQSTWTDNEFKIKRMVKRIGR